MFTAEAKSLIGVPMVGQWKWATLGGRESRIGDTGSKGNEAKGQSTDNWDGGQNGGLGSYGDAIALGSGWAALLLECGGGGGEGERCGAQVCVPR